MATDLALNSEWVIFFTGVNGEKDLALIAGAEQVAQNVKQRLALHRGEWFIDRNAGVPWVERILNKGNKQGYDQGISETIILNTIKNTPGVEQIVGEVNFDWDFSNGHQGRRLRVLDACILADCDSKSETQFITMKS